MADALNGAAPSGGSVSTAEPTAASSQPSGAPTGGHYVQPTAFLDGDRVKPEEIAAAAAKASGGIQQTLPFVPPDTKTPATPVSSPQAPQTPVATPPAATEEPFYKKYGGFQSEEAFKSGFSAAAADYHAKVAELNQLKAYVAQQQQMAQQVPPQAPQSPTNQPAADTRFLPLESRVARHFGMQDGQFTQMIRSQDPATQAQAIEMINEYQVMNNPRIQQAWEERTQKAIQAALQPLQQQLQPMQQTAAQYQAEREQQAFLSDAQPMLDSVYAALPQIKSNEALNKAFAEAINKRWESVKFCISKGINPFTDIAEAVAFKNQAALAEAEKKAAEERLRQTGGILSATPRVGMADTNTKPANAYENAVRKAATLGADQSVVDQFWKAMNRHSAF